MSDNDEDPEALRRHLFGAGPDSPPLLDPAGWITLDEVVAFSQRWQRSRGRTNADVVLDPDGLPIAVGESYPVICAGLAIWQADAERLGIAEGDYPGILIISTPKKKGTTQ